MTWQRQPLGVANPTSLAASEFSLARQQSRFITPSSHHFLYYHTSTQCYRTF